LTSELGQVCGKSVHKGQYHLVIGDIKHHTYSQMTYCYNT